MYEYTCNPFLSDPCNSHMYEYTCNPFLSDPCIRCWLLGSWGDRARGDGIDAGTPSLLHSARTWRGRYSSRRSSCVVCGSGRGTKHRGRATSEGEEQREQSRRWDMGIGNTLASFPGHRRNGLATSANSNSYSCCLKVGSTNQISGCCHMTTVKPNRVMHWTITVTPISSVLAIAQSR